MPDTHGLTTQLPDGAATGTLPPCIDFLQAFGVDSLALNAAAKRARRYGVSPADALLVSGSLAETDYYRCVAFELQLRFSDTIKGDGRPRMEMAQTETVRREARLIRIARTSQGTDTDPLYIAPDCASLGEMKRFFANRSDYRVRTTVTTTRAALDHENKRTERYRLHHSINALRHAHSEFSARRVMTPIQAIWLILLLQILFFLWLARPADVLFGLHMAAAVFFVGCTGLRFLAAAQLARAGRRDRRNARRASVSHDQPLWKKRRATPDMVMDEGVDTPFYSVLIALYREAGQVDDLVDSLLDLQWPPEKLEIKLVCEADDTETIEAVRRAQARIRSTLVDLVMVPAAYPRTKPKALNFALPLCRGDYVVIYDAEDRPHEGQLQEARQAFLNAADPNLACLQAPLEIHNHHEHWLSRLFAIEYSALFRGLLPCLAKLGGPVPLGGTSNHFRRDILNTVGAWDPYNVTEDADLGIRFARHGYSIGTLTLPTYEEAPVNLGIWLKQRTRWLKGWMQTLLVHMRHPVITARDLGFGGTIIFHLMVTGMIVSALIHPIILGLVLARFVDMGTGVEWGANIAPLFVFDFSILLLGYLSFGALAWQTLGVSRLKHLRWGLLLLPLYWSLISIAAWRALFHVMVRPHEWEKTPHRITQLQP